LSAARRNDAEPALISRFRERIDSLTEQRERFDRERMTLQIFIEDDQGAYKQTDVLRHRRQRSPYHVVGAGEVRQPQGRSLGDVMKHALP
jgi:hypothetical protein